MSSLRFFLFLSLCSLARLPAQTTITFIPTADAFVTTGPVGNDRSNNNYGGAGALGIAASGKPQGEFQSLMRFTVGQLTGSLQSITLRLTAQNPNNAIFNTAAAGSFNIYWQQNDNYQEGTGSPNSPTSDGVTFNSLSALQSPADELLGTFSFNGATSGNFTYTLALPPGFTNDVLSGGSVSLRLTAADANIAFLFGSRTMGANAPLLSITTVPEPSAALLLLGGAAFIIVCTRRRLTSR